MTTKEKIIELFSHKNDLTIRELTEYLQVSKQMIHLVMNQLQLENKIVKLGRPPKTIYRNSEKQASGTEQKTWEGISETENEFLKTNFLMISDTGYLLEGKEGFANWCRERNLPFLKTLKEFIVTKKKYEKYYDKTGLINGMEKIKNTKGYDSVWLDSLFYLDFYAIERFGKTRLGTLLHYSKQGQNKMLMAKMMQETSDRIKNFIMDSGFDAIGFVPPTIKREVQLMKFIQNYLQVTLPVVEIKKFSGLIPVPQKSLSKIEERIKNATNTFAVTDRRSFNKIMLMDDALGSGATLNIIAQKIKNKGTAQKITGLVMVGSFKGFEIITDV